MGQTKYEWGWHGFMGPYHGGVVLTRNTRAYIITLYIWSRPPAGYPPPPHGMVQVGVQGQGRGMPLQPHH